MRDMSMEGRLTLCNLSIEMGARGGFIAPDEKTFADKDLMRDVARISHTVIGEYGDFNAEAKKVIWDLEEAWEDAVPMFAELYLANHPDASDEIVISTEEIIQTMFLDYAGEAFAAGVPIEDILC